MSTLKPLFIVGAGGLGREVLDVVDAINSIEPSWEFLGFVSDDEPDEGLLQRLETRWLGTLDQAKSIRTAYFSIGIGSGEIRARVANQVSQHHELATLVHPNATIGRDVRLGDGVTICSHVSATTNIEIGSTGFINLSSTVGHDCVLGEAVTINPGVNISGNVAIGAGATIGTGASIIQGLNVGEGAFVGAGAAVVGDVEAGSTVVGVPAKAI